MIYAYRDRVVALSLYNGDIEAAADQFGYSKISLKLVEFITKLPRFRFA